MYMKRFYLLAVAGLMMAGAASLYAQVPQGPEGAQLPEGFNPENIQIPPVLTPEQKTAQMTEKYNLTPEQQAAVLELNTKYDGKLDFRMEPMDQSQDPRKMSDAERQQFFDQMMNRMADMQERQQQMQKDQKEYDKAMKNILDKNQYRIYRKEMREREEERLRMQQGMGGGFPGGGMPGGGFPGGPGGFPGGGFPGGGFPGGF